MTEVKRGRVVSFNSSSARGTLEVGGSEISFGATSFESGRPTRFPQEGDKVVVVFVAGYAEPLSVRLEKPSKK